MARDHLTGAGSAGLLGRRSECDQLDRLMDAVRGGESRVLVLTGEAGVGKTALLDYVSERATGCNVRRCSGVQSEMELVFSGLYQLCRSMLKRIERLPEPQRDALHTAFGLSAGPTPDRFFVALAASNLLSDVAEERPLICLVDDEQWLDRASAQACAFVARRLDADAMGIIFASREPGQETSGLAQLPVAGLSAAEARSLLDSVIASPMDGRVRERIVAETRGNPLALRELARASSRGELAGGFGLPGAVMPPQDLDKEFRRQLDDLPAASQRFLPLAAADPIGESPMVWDAAERLGLGPEAATPAVEAGLLELGSEMRFRHPLVRSAAYRSASRGARIAVHNALAQAVDPRIDPDRRAWHRAHATTKPDEQVAAELERCAAAAQARGGLSAVAAFMERSARLTPEPAGRAGRALAAAQARLQAGATESALALLGEVEAGQLQDGHRARADLLHAQLAFVASRGREAPSLLLRAAERLAPLDVDLARETYLDALSAALFAGRLSVPGGGSVDVALAARAAPPPPDLPRASDLLLDGLAGLFVEGYSAGVPTLKQALDMFGGDMSTVEQLRWMWLACVAALHVWDDERWAVLSDRYVTFAHNTGALAELPLALNMRAYGHVFAGQLSTAASLCEQIQIAGEATGARVSQYGALAVAALRGREAETTALIELIDEEARPRGDGIALSLTAWAAGVLYNGLGRYDDALAAARRASDHPHDLGPSSWAMAEVIEAAARRGTPESAAETHRRLKEMTEVCGGDWGLGIEARSRALLNEGDTAEDLYREAIERLAHTRMRAELARAHLVYGEWLWAESRRADAREQLRIAHEMLVDMGIEAFAERARRGLLATGDTVQNRSVLLRTELTAQELRIAQLARDGLSNPEIGARLFISRRTVRYHLQKVFARLDITSREELHHALPADAIMSRP